MNGEFINPNWHAVLIHFPIGLLGAGVLVELIALGWPGRGLRAAGRWMILLGALAALPALLAGLYALRQTVQSAPSDPDLPWAEVARLSPWSAKQWEFMTDHVWLNGFAVAIFAIVAVAGLAVADRLRRAIHGSLLVLLLAGMGLMGAGAWHGGEAVYRLGTAVTVAGRLGAAPEAGGLTYYLPPLELHIVLAGLAVALALGALGLTIRAWRAGAKELRAQRFNLRPPILARPGPHAAPPLEDPLAEDSPIAEEDPAPPVSPRAFWLLGALTVVAAVAAGVWSFMGGFSAVAWRTNLDALRDPDQRRVFVHVIFGVALLSIVLIHGIPPRLAWRHRALSKIFALLLLVAVVVQLWLGIALLFDSPSGPLYKFSSPAPAATAPPAS